MSVRLALLDDEHLFRRLFARALHEEGFEVVVEAADARGSFAAIDSASPDVAIVELALPTMDGVTAIRELRVRRREMGIFALTRVESPQLLASARESGAHAIATKRHDLDVVLEGIRRAAKGERFVATGLTIADEDGEANPLTSLSAREGDIFRLIAVQGLTNAEIAQQLCISPKTVETHRTRIMKKLGVHSAAGLVRMAARHGLIDP